MISTPEAIIGALSSAVEAERQKNPDISQTPTALCLFAEVDCPVVLFELCTPRRRYEEVGTIYDSELRALLGDACDFEAKLGKTFEEISPVPFRKN